MNMMKQWLFALAVVGTLFMTACNDDTTDDPTVGPTLSLISGSEFDGAVLSPSDSMTLSIRGIAGSSEINSLTFFEDGVRLPDWETRLLVDNQAAPSNSLLLDGSSRDDFTLDVVILANDAEGEYDITIEIIDDNNESASVSLTYMISNLDTIMGVLLNQGGPAGTGGLDLDEGIGTGSTDASAEIRDLGIDNTLPLDENWLQQIAGVNGSDIATVSSEFNFASVNMAQGVIDAFDEANIVAETEKIEVGDVFAVRNGTNFYLIEIAAINVTADDNSDNYEINIKKGQ